MTFYPFNLCTQFYPSLFFNNFISLLYVHSIYCTPSASDRATGPSFSLSFSWIVELSFLVSIQTPRTPLIQVYTLNSLSLSLSLNISRTKLTPAMPNPSFLLTLQQTRRASHAPIAQLKFNAKHPKILILLSSSYL